MEDSTSRDAHVLVVGAGAAGLAAALALAARSIRVIVVDARDRVGGRVRWQHVGSVDAPAELGAEFIYGDAPETSALLRRAGLGTAGTGDRSWTCTDDGTLQRAGGTRQAGRRDVVLRGRSDGDGRSRRNGQRRLRQRHASGRRSGTRPHA